MNNMKSVRFAAIFFQFVLVLGVVHLFAQFPGWKTDWDKKSIDLSELLRGGPPKDGIPSINRPKFVSQDEAAQWLKEREPVIVVELNGEARAYPIQILIWHEMANDELGGTPILVTFCPLCYSAITFDRRVDGREYFFGVSGFLRHSDMIMFDRQTESLWQQFSGEAVVGELTGKRLKIIPSQLISFEQFREAYPGAVVLSKETGHSRRYGENPYAGYDDVSNSPFAMKGNIPDRLKPMEKVVGVRLQDDVKTYPYRITRKKKVLHDTIGDRKIVVFHTDGATSALDQRQIHRSRVDGSTGVFFTEVDEQSLSFEFQDGEIRDQQTGSVWNIAGKAVSGSLQGKQLQPAIFGDYFAFAWLVFYPDAAIYGKE